MKNAFFFFLLLLLFSFINCTDNIGTDNPPVDDPAVKSFIEATINETGGIIELDEFIVTIPAGAFESSYDLKVSVLDQDDSGFDQALSALCQIEGLPEKINAPIQLSLKKSGTGTENSYIAIGESTYIKSLDEEGISYQLTDATENEGFIIGEIPTLVPEDGFMSESIDNREVGKITLKLLAIAGYSSILSSNGHFRVYVPTTLSSEITNLSSYLEAAYTKFNQLGFSYSKRTRWPVHVTVKNLNSADGVYINSIWGNNYGYIEIDKKVLNSENEMKTTAGHEFFHLVQSFYDPRNSYSKAKFKTPHLWLDEAMSVWSEELFVTGNYVSPVFIQNAPMVLQGMKLGQGAEAQNYGYGMAVFIKYIVKLYGEDKLLKIYDEIYDGSSPVAAINAVIPQTIALKYDNFLEEFLSFKLYNNEDFGIGWLVAATGSPGYFNIASKADSVKKFNHIFPDLSARVYYLKNNQFTDFAKSAYVSFELDGTNDDHIMLFKFNATESQLINKGQDTLTLDGFKAILDDGYKVVAVASHQKLDYPYGDEKELEFTIRIKEKFEFDYVDFNIKGKALIDHNNTDTFWGDTTYISQGDFYIGLTSIASQNQSSSFSGNSVNISADFQEATGENKSCSINIEFDDIKDPKNILSFSFNESYTYSFNGGLTNRTTSINMVDIPFIEVYTDINNLPEYRFRLDGNFDSNILDAAYYESYTYPDGARIKNLIDFEGDGYVRITFKQKP